MEWISRPFKLTLRNKGEEYEDKELDVIAPLDSIEDGIPGEKDNKGREDDREDDSIYNRKDTVLYDTKDSEEEASSGQEGESSSLKLSESSDDEG